MSDSITFADLDLSASVLEAIEAAGYVEPTPIQQQAVPVLLAGGDVILQAQTGTGKTAAFVLPIAERMEPQPGRIEALVLAPTRELARQVAGEFDALGGRKGIVAAAIYGGTGFQGQYDALEKANVVVATPGRLLDLLRRKRISLDAVRVFGLDEGDEMLSMGFEKDVLDIVRQLPRPRQSFMCSATLNEHIKRVAAAFITDATTINTSSDEIGARSVDHVCFRTSFDAKHAALRRIIEAESIEGAIVFANTRAATFRVTEALRQEGYNVDVLNGDLSQPEREKALHRMRDDRVQFLVATDVAARGIDISGLPAVINYDMPESPDVYIHRTGRTGRAGQAGVAYSLVEPGDITTFHALEKLYKLELIQRPLPDQETVRNIKADRAIAEALTDLDADGTLDYASRMPLARRLVERGDVKTIARLIAAFAEGATATATAAVAPAEAAPAAAPTPEPASAAPAAAMAAPAEATVEAAAEETAAPAPVHPSDDGGDAEQEDGRRRRRRRRRGRRSDEDTDATSAAEPSTEVAAEATPEPNEPAAKRPSRRRKTADADADADGGVPASLADDALAWFDKNVGRRGRGRFVSVSRIAKDLGVTDEQLDDRLVGDDRFERGRGRRPVWRLRRESSTPPPPRPARPGVASPDDIERPGFVTLRVNIGASTVDDAETLAHDLVNLAGLDREDLGAIQLHPTYSVVEVREDYWTDFQTALHRETLHGQSLAIKRADS